MKDARNELLKNKRAEISELIDQCINGLEQKSKENSEFADVFSKAKRGFEAKREGVLRLDSLNALEAKKSTLIELKNQYAKEMDDLLKLVTEKTVKPAPSQPSAPIRKRGFYMQAVFPKKTLKSKQDIDTYVEDIRKLLLGYLDGVDELDIK